MPNKVYKDRRFSHSAIYWITIGTVLIIIYKLLDNFTAIGNWFGKLFSIIAPFLSAILIAYILYVPCRNVEKLLLKKMKRHPKTARNISILIVYILAILIITLLLRFLIPQIWSSVKDLIDNITYYYGTINNDELNIEWAPSLQNVGPWIQENILKPLVEYLEHLDLSDMFTEDKIKAYISSTIGVVRGVANFVVAFICSIYILGERTEIVKFFSKWVKSRTTNKGYMKFKKYFVSGSEIFFTFLSTQLLDGIIVGTLLAISFSIIRVKYAIFLGEMIGLFNLIPFFGPIIAVVAAVIITILTSGWKKAIILAIVATAISQLDSHVINPKLTGSRLSISPLLVIISVTVGGAYFGPMGMFLAVPIATTIKVIIDDGVSERLQAKINSQKNTKSFDVEKRKASIKGQGEPKAN